MLSSDLWNITRDYEVAMNQLLMCLASRFYERYMSIPGQICYALILYLMVSGYHAGDVHIKLQDFCGSDAMGIQATITYFLMATV